MNLAEVQYPQDITKSQEKKNSCINIIKYMSFEYVYKLANQTSYSNFVERNL